MSTDPNLVIAIIVGAIAVFGAGFATGRHVEKSSNEQRRLSERLDKIENRLVNGIQNDPTLATWVRNNITELLALLNTFRGENTGNG